MEQHEPRPPTPPADEDVAGGIVKLFEAEAARVETERRAGRLMLEAVRRVVGRVMTALTVVDFREWRERRGR